IRPKNQHYPPCPSCRSSCSCFLSGSSSISGQGVDTSPLSLKTHRPAPIKGADRQRIINQLKNECVMRRREFIYALNAGMVASLAPTPALAGLFNDAPNHMRMQDELAYHTIKAVTFGHVRMQYPRFVGKNARLDVHGFGPRIDICTISTDKGAKGWASLRGGREHAQRMLPELIGKKLSDVFQIAVGITDDRYLPFDIALHDLAGVALNKPVYALLGRDTPYTTKYYSGMIYFDDLEPAHAPGGIDKVLDECRYDYEFGYRQYKLKIGRSHRWMSQKDGLARDIAVTKAVVEAFPDCDTLVDGNTSFTVNEFIEYLTGI